MNEQEIDSIFAIKEVTNVDCQIFVYDNQILFHPILPCVAETLTITEKSLECSAETGFVRKVMFRSREMFSTCQRQPGTIGVTFQGFLHRIIRTLVKKGFTFNVQDLRVAKSYNGDFPRPDFSLMYGFRFSQEELLKEFLSADMSGLIGAPTRYGKCHIAGTKVLMYDYSIKVVEDVQVGDLLMGPDGLPRKVVALGRGREQAYNVIPNKGEPFGCNESHILSLKVTGGAKFGGYKKGDVVNITIKEYLGRSKTFKHVTKLWYAPLEFSEKDLPYDPWMVGVWIGDGCINGRARITKPDKNVQSGIIAWAERCGLLWSYKTSNTENDTISVRTIEGVRTSKNPLTEIARMCVVDDEKRIPLPYLTASRSQRLELLAGIIDTDGYSNNGMAYELVTKYEGLSEDVIQLCRGLGFRVTRKKTQKGIKSTGFVGTYYRIQIAGPIQDIPCRGHKNIDCTVGRVNPTVTGFKLEDIGEQDYYGFEIEGPDRLYLNWDHCVTHNTTLMINTLRAFPDLVTVVTAPGVDLVRQLYDDIKEKIRNREVKLICSGSRTKYPSDTGITVCSADSLEKCDFGSTELLLADEPHALVTEGRIRMIDKFPKARRLGFGATLTGRFDGKDALIEGLFGPVIVERTYKEAVDEGAICPLHIIFLKVEVQPQPYRDRDAAYDDLLFKSSTMANLTKDICEYVIPQEWQTLIFIKHEPQAELFLDAIGDSHTIAMAKRMNKSQREEIAEMMRKNVIKRCLCTKIYVQGVTFSDVRVLINAEAGGNNTSAIQKPGRLAEIRPNKKCGIVIDFMFVPPDDVSLSDYSGDPWTCPCRDSLSRLTAYQDKGYEIHEVDTVEELKRVFDSIA